MVMASEAPMTQMTSTGLAWSATSAWRRPGPRCGTRPGSSGRMGAVDHTSREGGLLAGTALALEVTARDAAGGVHLLVEVDGEREEVVVLALLGDDHRGEDGGVAPASRRRHRSPGGQSSPASST